MWIKDNKEFQNPVEIEIERKHKKGDEIITEKVKVNAIISDLSKNNQTLVELGYNWVEPPKKYSQLKIIRKLGDNWITIKRELDNMGYLDQFLAADYLKENDSIFQAFIQNVPSELVAELENCLWEND